VLRGALKVFPFPRCTLSRPSTATLHRSREYIVPLLANTSIRRACEWFSSWPGLPRFFGRGEGRDSYTAFLRGGSNQIARAKKGYEGWREREKPGKGKQPRSKGGTCGAVRGIMSSKYVVKFLGILHTSNCNSSLSSFFISSDKSKIYVTGQVEIVTEFKIACKIACIII